MNNKKLIISVCSIMTICAIGLAGCGSNKKTLEALNNAANEKQWDYICDNKTLITTIERNEDIFEYVIEPGDYGDTYCKSSSTKSDYTSMYYMKDGYIMLYTVDKKGTGYAERTHSLPTDYVWAEKIPGDLVDAIADGIDGNKETELKVKETPSGYIVSYNALYSSGYKSAEVKLDKSYNFESAVIKVSDNETINLPVFKFSDDKVNFPEVVKAAVDQLKSAK